MYADAQSIRGVRIPDNAIIVHSDELALVKRYGLYRLLARLGRQRRHLPFPPWTDRDRKRVTHADDPKSVLKMFGGKINYPPASLVLEDKSAVLQLLRDDGAELVKQLAQVPADMPFVITTRPAHTAHAWFVWTPGQTEPEAITGPNPSSASITGGFLAFVIGSDRPDQITQMEDGFVLMMSAQRWARCSQALAEGQPFEMQPSTAGELAFALRWIEQTVRSPVDGKLRHAERGWHRYTPDSGQRAPGSGEIMLLSSDRELEAAIAVSALSSYIKQIYSCVEDLAPRSIARTTLTLHIELAPGAAPVVQLAATPTLAIAAAVCEVVAALAPPVNGPLVFEVATKIGNDA